MSAGEEYWSCIRKRGFTSRRHARDAISRSRKHGGPPLFTYFCQLCRKYHLTRRAQ